MSHIETRTLGCPLCGESVEGHVVLPERARGPITTDLRRYGSVEDPLPKMVNLCKACGFAAEALWFEALAPRGSTAVAPNRTGWFETVEQWEDAHDPVLAGDRTDGPSTLREQVRAHLRPRLPEAIGNAARSWEFAAHVSRWAGAPALREGDALLRAAWLWEDAGAAGEGQRCRRRARERYESAIREQQGFGRREDLVVIAYLCGELRRREGARDDAHRWFDQSIAWSSGLPSMQELVALAERQRRDPRDLV